ncbi:hypothetical protein [Rhizobium sp. CAU 1783]
MKARCLFVAVAAFLVPLFTQAEDRSRIFTDLFGKIFTDCWWCTTAACAGWAKPLAPFKIALTRADPDQVEERMTTFWLVTGSRIQRARPISEKEASKVALEPTREGDHVQEQASLTYTVASRMYRVPIASSRERRPILDAGDRLGWS